MAIVLLFTLLLSQQLLADVPNTFEPGDTILSSEINANFESLNTRIDALETQSQNTSASRAVTIHGTVTVEGIMSQQGRTALHHCQGACVSEYGANARLCTSGQIINHLTTDTQISIGDYMLLGIYDGTRSQGDPRDISGERLEYYVVYLNVYDHEGRTHLNFNSSITSNMPLQIICCSEE